MIKDPSDAFEMEENLILYLLLLFKYNSKQEVRQFGTVFAF